MADFQQFRALRYDASLAGDASRLVAPPYDIVSEAERRELYGRSPYNIARVDYGEEQPGDTAADNRYRRARDLIGAWTKAGVLRLDTEPRLYVYDQEFDVGGKQLRRRAVFGRLRLEEWDRGVVLPHEHTRAAAKEDRLRLLEATGIHLSPILALYRGGFPIDESAAGAAVLEASLPDGQRHTLRPLDRAAAAALTKHLDGERLYVADGHHRYETALNYRNARRGRAAKWTGEEPENFVLAGLVDIADAGLVVLPTHRLVRLPRGIDAAGGDDLFERLPAGEATAAGLSTLLDRMRAARGAAFGAVGLETGKLTLLLPRHAKAIDAVMPADKPEPWRRLDVAILHHALLPALGFAAAPETLEFTDDAQAALEAVAAGDFDAGFFLNSTPVDQVLAVADTGERMPEKSTYFYPKLSSGIVMYPLSPAGPLRDSS